MRLGAFAWAALVVAAVGMAGGTLSGCGGDSTTARPPPAGRQPLPSSDPPRALPASGGGPRPMFTGPPREELQQVARGGGTIARMTREDQARYDREHAGPDRLGEVEGQAMAESMRAGLTAEEGGACAEAWQARIMAHEQHGAPSPGGATERRDFLEACGQLPEEQRNCMSPRYQGEHAEECAELQRQTVARLRRETGMDPERGRAPRTP